MALETYVYGQIEIKKQNSIERVILIGLGIGVGGLLFLLLQPSEEDIAKGILADRRKKYFEIAEQLSKIARETGEEARRFEELKRASEALLEVI